MDDDDDSAISTRTRKRKRNDSDEPPEWFKKFITKKCSKKHTDPEESDDDDVDDVDDDVDGDSDYDYFEKDSSQLRETILKHILAQLGKNQRKALQHKLKSGINKGFDQLKELVNENMGSLIGLQPTQNLWKLGMGPEEIKKYDKVLKKLRTDMTDKDHVTIQKILDAKIDTELKRRLVAQFDTLQNLTPYTWEYQEFEEQINRVLQGAKKSKLTQKDISKLRKKETELKKIIGLDTPLKIRILNANMDDARKAAIYEKYLLLEKARDDSVTAASLEEWIEEALKTPYTQILSDITQTCTPGECLVKLSEGFKTRLSDLDTILEPLLTVFNNRLHNPQATSTVIGLLGAPGTGKTALGKVIAEVWKIPFAQISLGGIMDSSILDGQHLGWVGSNPGRFAKALQEMGVINGVLFLDEIDKLGQTEHGLQVQYSLLHSTDPVQNNHFNDHYLGSKLPLDLSKTLIICALNTTNGMDPALLNRMHIIKMPDYTNTQKINILKKHLFPDALENASLNSTDVQLLPEACSTILNTVEQHIGKEGGVRGIKACVKMVVDKLGLLLRITAEEKTRLALSFTVNTDSKPVLITSQVVNELYRPGDLDQAWRHMYV